MEKRALIAIVLSVLILVLYQEWSARLYPPPMESPNKEGGTPQSARPARERGQSNLEGHGPKSG